MKNDIFKIEDVCFYLPFIWVAQVWGLILHPLPIYQAYKGGLNLKKYN